jgi:hypothetical protein
MSELLCPICGKNVQSVNVTPDCQHTSREIFEYIYSIKAELDEIKAELKQMGDYADELFADCATFLNERDALQAKLDFVIRSRDGWERDAFVCAQNSAKYENERDALRKQLDIAVDALIYYSDRHIYDWIADEALAKIKKLEELLYSL